jgi:hypothetical protein
MEEFRQLAYLADKGEQDRFGVMEAALVPFGGELAHPVPERFEIPGGSALWGRFVVGHTVQHDMGVRPGLTSRPTSARRSVTSGIPVG